MSTLFKLLADTHTHEKMLRVSRRRKGEKNPERMRHSPSMNVSPTKLNNPNKAQNDVFSCVCVDPVARSNSDYSGGGILFSGAALFCHTASLLVERLRNVDPSFWPFEYFFFVL